MKLRPRPQKLFLTTLIFRLSNLTYVSECERCNNLLLLLFHSVYRGSMVLSVYRGSVVLGVCRQSMVPSVYRLSMVPGVYSVHGF